MKYLEKIWTSELFISGVEDAVFDEQLRTEIHQSLDIIEKSFPSKHGKYIDQGKSIKQLCEIVMKVDGNLHLFTVADLMDFVNYAVPQDFTALMKGFAIQSISDLLLKRDQKSFTISFGTDIMTVNRPITLVSKYNPKFTIGLNNGCAFTSGNDDDVRGQHIKLSETNPYVVIHLIDDTGFRPIFCDYASTQIYSHLSEMKRWPHLKVIGMRPDGRAELLCDGNVPKPEEADKKEE